MTVKLIPAKAAVVRVVEPAQEAKVQLEVSLHEAYLIRALLGSCTGSQTQRIYAELGSVVNRDKFLEYHYVVQKANSGKNIHILSVNELLDDLKYSL